MTTGRPKSDSELLADIRSTLGKVEALIDSISARLDRSDTARDRIEVDMRRLGESVAVMERDVTSMSNGLLVLKTRLHEDHAKMMQSLGEVSASVTSTSREQARLEMDARSLLVASAVTRWVVGIVAIAVAGIVVWWVTGGP